MDFDAALKEADLVQDLFYGHKKLKALDDRVGDFPHLLKLGINHNRLKTLPESFAKLTQLEYLDINKNYFVELPDVLFENKNLKTLIAKHNRIKDISPRIAELQALEKLNIRDNLLKKLPEELGALPHLREVILQKNADLDIAQAIEVLSQLPEGLHLSLNECGIRKLPDNFVKLQNVTSLDISANYHLDLGHTIKQLTKLPNLEHLYFRHPMEAEDKLPERFTKLRHLKSLHIYASANIAEILSSFTELRVLDIARWGWFDNVPDTLPDWLLAMDKLEYLRLSNNKFKHLPSNLNRLKSLRSLDLDGHNMRDIPIELADIFPQLDSLIFTKSSALDDKKQAAFLEELQAIFKETGGSLSPNAIKAAFYLYQNRWQEASKICHQVNELLPLLELKTLHVVKYVLVLLEQYFTQQNLVPIAEGSVLFLAGKATQYNAKEVKKVLKAKKVKVVTTLSESVTHIVLAPNLKDKAALIQAHVDGYPNTQCLTEGMLQKWCMEQGETAQSLTEEDLDKITSLLLNGDAKNIMLGVSLMQNFEIIPALYSDLAALYLYRANNKALHKVVKPLFFQYLPTFLQALVLGYGGKTSNFNLGHIEQIAEEFPTFSLPRFINQAFVCRNEGKQYIFEHGGQLFAQVMERMLVNTYQNNQATPWLTVKFEAAKVSDQIKDLSHINRLKFETFSNQAERSLLIPEGIRALDKLTHLYFTYWYSPTIPPRLTALEQLEELNMNFHKLTEVPDHVAQWARLKALMLSHGKIERISPKITQLTQLRALDLMDNALTELPSFIGQLTALKTLILRDNQLTTLPPEIGALTELRILNLSNNPLTSLPPELANLTKLTYVSISNKVLAKQVQEWLPDCRVNQ
jgi:Leucine-rich repeat (LRR) protein